MTIQPQDTLMFREAHETAEVVERQLAHNEGVIGALAERLRANPPRMVITCAPGSSDHAAMYAKYVFETQLGVVTASASPSVTSIYHAAQRLDGALYVAISQSGKSPDLVRNAEAAKKAGAYVVALVNVVDSPLADVADVVVPLHAGPETQRRRAQELPRRAVRDPAYRGALEWQGRDRRGNHRAARPASPWLGCGLVGPYRWPGGCAQPFRRRSRLRLRRCARGGAEVQGTLRTACGSLQRGRGEARSH